MHAHVPKERSLNDYKCQRGTFNMSSLIMSWQEFRGRAPEFDTRGDMWKDAQARGDSLETLSEVMKITMKSWTQSLLWTMVQIQENVQCYGIWDFLDFILGVSKMKNKRRLPGFWLSGGMNNNSIQWILEHNENTSQDLL